MFFGDLENFNTKVYEIYKHIQSDVYQTLKTTKRFYHKKHTMIYLYIHITVHKIKISS